MPEAQEHFISKYLAGTYGTFLFFANKCRVIGNKQQESFLRKSKLASDLSAGKYPTTVKIFMFRETITERNEISKVFLSFQDRGSFYNQRLAYIECGKEYGLFSSTIYLLKSVIRQMDSLFSYF